MENCGTQWARQICDFGIEHFAVFVRPLKKWWTPTSSILIGTKMEKIHRIDISFAFEGWPWHYEFNSSGGAMESWKKMRGGFGRGRNERMGNKVWVLMSLVSSDRQYMVLLCWLQWLHGIPESTEKPLKSASLLAQMIWEFEDWPIGFVASWK